MPRVDFETADYVRSHGRQPKGWGMWAFEFEGDVADPKAEPWFVSRAMSFTDAKAEARVEAKRRATCSDAVVFVSVAP